MNANYRLVEYLYFDTGEGDILDENEFKLIKFSLNKCLQHVDPLPHTFLSCPATPGQEGAAAKTVRNQRITEMMRLIYMIFASTVVIFTLCPFNYYHV